MQVIGVVLILGLAAGSYYLWCLWTWTREIKTLRDRLREAAAEATARLEEQRSEWETVHARMRDIHSSLNKYACGRETTWPQ